jgi:SAM-dependent methyltransferase
LAARPRGRKESGRVVGGRIVGCQGPPALVEALAGALGAKGEIARVTHRFHTYPARMHPDAARSLFSALAGDVVLDPFCGGGTVLVEAMLAGRRAVGRDINPVAVLVAEARTRLCDATRRRTLETEARAVARAARDAQTRILDAVYALREWYAAPVLRELSALWMGIEGCRERDLLRAVHSSLVIKFSRRASDTSARLVDTHHPRGAVSRAFVDRAGELSTMLASLAESVPVDTPPAEVAGGDARTLEGVPQVDLICTSPPYPATYDYLPLQQLRLAWLGAATPNRDEIGARRHFRRSVDQGHAMWLADTARWMKASSDHLGPGGRLAILIGDGIARGQLLEARRPTEEAARAAGLLLEAAASIERVDPATQLAKREHALLFEKPS